MFYLFFLNVIVQMNLSELITQTLIRKHPLFKRTGGLFYLPRNIMTEPLLNRVMINDKNLMILNSVPSCHNSKILLQKQWQKSVNLPARRNSFKSHPHFIKEGQMEGRGRSHETAMVNINER